MENYWYFTVLICPVDVDDKELHVLPMLVNMEEMKVLISLLSVTLLYYSNFRFNVTID